MIVAGITAGVALGLLWIGGQRAIASSTDHPPARGQRIVRPSQPRVAPSRRRLDRRLFLLARQAISGGSNVTIVWKVTEKVSGRVVITKV